MTDNKRRIQVALASNRRERERLDDEYEHLSMELLELVVEDDEIEGQEAG